MCSSMFTYIYQSDFFLSFLSSAKVCHIFSLFFTAVFLTTYSGGFPPLGKQRINRPPDARLAFPSIYTLAAQMGTHFFIEGVTYFFVYMGQKCRQVR